MLHEGEVREDLGLKIVDFRLAIEGLIVVVQDNIGIRIARESEVGAQQNNSVIVCANMPSKTRHILNPVFLLSLVVLLLNDHVLKATMLRLDHGEAF